MSQKASKSISKREGIESLRQLNSSYRRVSRRSGISVTELRMIRAQFPSFWRELKRVA